MANFIIRVELHNAQSQHYTALAKKLAQSGVSDVITAGDGSKYKLPPAEYFYTGNETLVQVVSSVKQIANTVIASNAVLASQAENIRWEGLEQVRQYA